jgi:Holliday junction resolvase RusA-like endonuclease
VTHSAIELHIPVLPTSANDMNGYGRGTVYRSKAYEKWLNSAGLIIKSQKPGGIVGAYKLTIQAVRQNKRADIDNIIKPTSDLLQLVGVVANDCYCEFVSARWVSQGEGMSIRLERAVTA